MAFFIFFILYFQCRTVIGQLIIIFCFSPWLFRSHNTLRQNENVSRQNNTVFKTCFAKKEEISIQVLQVRFRICQTNLEFSKLVSELFKVTKIFQNSFQNFRFQIQTFPFQFHFYFRFFSTFFFKFYINFSPLHKDWARILRKKSELPINFVSWECNGPMASAESDHNATI